MNVCEAHSWCCFSLLLIHAERSVLLLRRKLVKKRQGSLKTTYFIENTRLVGGSKTQDLNLRTDLTCHVVLLDNDFPRLNIERPPSLWEQVGIPPKIIYRSVKSYTTHSQNWSHTIKYCLVSYTGHKYIRSESCSWCWYHVI